MKTKTQTHTPGPWIFAFHNQPGSYQYDILSQNHGRGLVPAARIPKSPFADANARLIAQAPTMLNLLNAISYGKIEANGANTSWREITSEARTILAAIEKGE